MTSKINHGGFAFPTPELRAPDGRVLAAGGDGMSLRDYFAGQALGGLLAAGADDDPTLNVPVRAYSIADDMLRASLREPRETGEE